MRLEGAASVSEEGLSFELSDNGQPATHFGFLEISVNGPGDASPYAIELAGFAYEIDSGISISTFSVPELGTALLLAFGLAMCALLGRREKSFRTRRQLGESPERLVLVRLDATIAFEFLEMRRD
jgi:hypothetical protein